jgi:hypothetical protein
MTMADEGLLLYDKVDLMLVNEHDITTFFKVVPDLDYLLPSRECTPVRELKYEITIRKRFHNPTTTFDLLTPIRTP